MVILVARKSRIKSINGIYHVMMRGNNRNVVFKCKKDYEKYICILNEYKNKELFELYAYCIMPNHIHLLIKTNIEIGKIFSRIGAKFGYWYNNKYDRVGHIFQGRFKSEVVEEISYFKTLLRYIHQNPIKANIVGKLYEYEWSSYHEYLSFGQGTDPCPKTKKAVPLCSIELGIYMFSNHKSEAIEKFIKFHEILNTDSFLEKEYNKKSLSDDKVKSIFLKILRESGKKHIFEMKKLEQREIIKILFEKGAGIRQISRITKMKKSNIGYILRNLDRGLSPVQLYKN